MVGLVSFKESAIEKKVCERVLNELGVASLKLNVRSNTGWPDRLFLIPGGRPLFIEFKAVGEELRPKQIYIHSVLTQRGYKVEVHDDAEAAFKSVARALAAA